MYKILQKQPLNDNTFSMVIEAPLVAKKAKPGQFIIIRTTEDSERIPLTITDFDEATGGVTIIVQVVGYSTEELDSKQAGEYISDFVGPLGVASELDELDNVLCVGGGIGIAPLFPQIKYLQAQGKTVDVIIGARNKDLLILTKETEPLCRDLYLATDDGSVGHHGFVTDVLQRLVDKGKHYERVIAVGPLVMMKAVSNLTKKIGIPTTVSMNPVMLDGTGMCGACRVTVGGETKYACVDGPEFDGHLLDFDEAIRRQKMYHDEEHECRLLREVD